MSRIRPAVRECAKRLLSQESRRSSNSEDKRSGLTSVCDNLNSYLVKLMGPGAYGALFSRGLALSREEVPWLAEIRVLPDGSLEGLEELERQKSPDEFANGAEVLISNFLDLLVTFIGEALTMHLVQEACSSSSKQESQTLRGENDEEI